MKFSTIRFFTFIFYIAAYLLPASAQADFLKLANGDVLKVEPVREDARSWTVYHESLGEFKVPKEKIRSFAPDIRESPEPQRGDLKTDSSLSAGYEMAQGNTDTAEFQGDFLYNRNRLWIDEWTVKANGLKSYADDQSTAQRYETSLRYGYSLTKRLYDFARVSAEHDYFQNVKLRLVPTAGLGYWFLDDDRSKLLAETGTGYDYEFLRPEGTEATWILHGRVMASRQVTEKLKAVTDVYIFPEVLDFGNYRIQADAGVEYALNSRWLLKFEIQDRYRSEPPGGSKRNDLRLITGLRFKL